MFLEQQVGSVDIFKGIVKKKMLIEKMLAIQFQHDTKAVWQSFHHHSSSNKG
jgi:hypothetical protein